MQLYLYPRGWSSDPYGWLTDNDHAFITLEKRTERLYKQIKNPYLWKNFQKSQVGTDVTNTMS